MSPSPLERDLVKCEDMRIHAERAVQYMGSRTLDEFVVDDMTQAAVIRCVEVVGEAARLVSEETRLKADGIPWAMIVGMRHILAHDYAAVNLDRVYDVVKNHLPDLLTRLGPLIRQLERRSHWHGEKR